MYDFITGTKVKLLYKRKTIIFYESTLGKVTVNLYYFPCAPARRVSHRRILLTLIVVRLLLLLLLFYGLKKLLWPPRVFMEGD